MTKALRIGVAFQLFLSVGAFASQGPKLYVSKNYGTRHAMGFTRDAKALSFLETAPRQVFRDADGPVPGSFSMEGLAGPVEDQGQCGSCWDFALTTTLRGTWMMGGHDTGELSFNYLLNCATDQQGCDGGDFTAAAWLLLPKGAPKSGSDGFYSEEQSPCVPEPAVGSAVAYHMLGPSGGSPSFRDIAYVVGVLHRPVSVDLAADDNWQSYGWGVYNDCSDEWPNDINHMVVIEGYDCGSSVDAHGDCVFDANGNLPPEAGTWRVRNSWGGEWGEDGYITTFATDSFGTQCNQIAHDALYFDPQ